MPSRSRAHTILSAALAAMAFAMAVLASSQPAWAATAGSLDTSFGTAGYSTVALGTWAGAASVAVQPDGKIVSAGQAEVNGENVIVVTRMTTSGALDPSFGTGGISTVHINGGAGMDSGAALVLQPDGRIVLAGSGNQTIYGPTSFAAVR